MADIIWLQNLQGAPGPQGPIGATGPQGLTGATGQTGAKGDKGDSAYPAPSTATTGKVLTKMDSGALSYEYAETIPLAAFGVTGTDNQTDYAKIMDALWNKLGGNGNNDKLKIVMPGGKLNCLDTFYLPKNMTLVGNGTDDPWNADQKGTIVASSGAGTGRRWTDIDGNDSATFKPVIAFCGSDSTVQDFTVITDPAQRWSAGIFIPSLRRIRIKNVDTQGQFAAGGIYGDATWSHLNTTLKSLHPDIIPDTGLNELSIDECFALGKWGVVIQGTTRDPDLYDSNTFVWAPGGTSDIVISRCRMGASGLSAELQVDGGGFKHDAANRGVTGATQGIYIVQSSFRSGSRYLAYFDASNRVVIDGCYGETISSWVNAGNPAATVFFGPKAKGNEFLFVNDRVNANFESASGTTVNGNAPWHPDRPGIRHRTDGRVQAPNTFLGGKSTSLGNNYYASKTGGNKAFIFNTLDPVVGTVAEIASIGSEGLTYLGTPLKPFTKGADLAINASGVVTLTEDFHRVDTFSGAASGQILDINFGTVQDGRPYLIRQVAGIRTLEIVHNGTSIVCAGNKNILLNNTNIFVECFKVFSIVFCRVVASPTTKLLPSFDSTNARNSLVIGATGELEVATGGSGVAVPSWVATTSPSLPTANGETYSWQRVGGKRVIATFRFAYQSGGPGVAVTGVTIAWPSDLPLPKPAPFEVQGHASYVGAGRVSSSSTVRTSQLAAVGGVYRNAADTGHELAWYWTSQSTRFGTFTVVYEEV